MHTQTTIAVRRPRRGALRRGALTGAAVGALALAGCRGALDVNNPKYIDEGSLDNAALATVLMNSAVGAVTYNYSEFSWFSAILTDEALNATNDYRSGELNQRIVELAQGNIGPYPLLQYTRATADTAAGRLRVISKKPQGDLKLARALAYAGYGYVYLAEFTCTAPLNGGALVSDDSLFRIAIARFNEAITDATGGTPTAAADSIIELARIGAARASLDLGDKASALTYANAAIAKDQNFVVRANYIVSGNTALENSLWFRVNGQNKQLGVHPLMQGLNDPRIPYDPKAVLGHNQLTFLNIPFAPRSFSNFNATKADSIRANSSIDMASGLEARYIRAFAEGATATTIALVNERRAVGNEPALSAAALASPDSIMAGLREEKRRDFFLAGRRLGDLRRYLKEQTGDFFPTGPHPTTQWGLYGKAVCYIITQDEVNSNPNVASYAPPSTRPPGYSP